MSTERSRKIAEHIGAAIIKNTRKRWSGLHSDAVSAIEKELIRMSTPTSSTLNGDGKGQTRPEIGRPIPDSPSSLAEAAPARLARSGAIGKNDTTSGMACNDHQIPDPVAKPVDFRTITGSYAGDHRAQPGDVAKASLDKAADNGGPRNSAGQFKSSKFESQPPFKSTPTGLDSDAGV